jgi:hypothetical protein
LWPLECRNHDRNQRLDIQTFLTQGPSGCFARAGLSRSAGVD